MTWLFRLATCVNSLQQNLHLKGFSPVWVLVWLFNWVTCMKALLQNLHWYGFSPVWILTWLFKLTIWAKALLQNLHLYGFSPEWILPCSLKELLSLNTLLHTWQLYRFFLVWVFKCAIWLSTLCMCFGIKCQKFKISIKHFIVCEMSTFVMTSHFTFTRFHSRCSLLWTTWSLCKVLPYHLANYLEIYQKQDILLPMSFLYYFQYLL